MPRIVETAARGRLVVWDTPGPIGAPTLVLLHGVTLDAESNWGAAVPTLAQSFRVLARTCAGTEPAHRPGRRTGWRTVRTTSPPWYRRWAPPRDRRRLLDGRHDRADVLAPVPGADGGARALRDGPQRVGLLPRAADGDDDAVPRRRRRRDPLDLPAARGPGGRPPARRRARPPHPPDHLARMRRMPLVTALAAMQAVCEFSSHRWIGGVDVPWPCCSPGTTSSCRRAARCAWPRASRGAGRRGGRRPRRLPRRTGRLRPALAAACLAVVTARDRPPGGTERASSPPGRSTRPWRRRPAATYRAAAAANHRTRRGQHGGRPLTAGRSCLTGNPAA